MDSFRGIFDRDGIVRICLILFPSILGFLIVFSPVWTFGAPVEMKGVVAFIVSGILLFISGWLIFLRPKMVTVRIISILAIASLLLFWPFYFSTVKGGAQSALTGIAFEPGTFFSFVSFASALLAGYMYASSGGRLRSLIAAVIAGSCAILFLTVIGILFKSTALSGLFGGWFSTGLLFGTSFLFLLAYAAVLATTHRLRVYSATCALLFLLATFLFRSSELLIVLGVAGLATVLVLGWARRFEEEGVENKSARRIVWALITMALLGGIFNLHKYTPDSPFLNSLSEPKLSFTATAHTILRAYDNSRGTAFIGTGLGTFGAQWAKHRPEVVSSSPLWDRDFETWSGLIPTLAVTIGFPLTFFLIMLLASAWLGSASHILRNKNETNFDAISALAVLAFLFYWLIFYTPNLALLIIFGILLGAVLNVGHTDDRPTESKYVSFFNQLISRWSWIPSTVATLLLYVGLSLFMLGGLQFLALQKYYSGIETSSSDADGKVKTLEYFETSMKYAELPRTVRALSGQYLQLAKKSATATQGQPLTADVALALEYAKKAVTYGKRAIELDGEGYRNWIELGNSQALLGILGEKGSLEQGVAGYRNAQTRAPTHPLAYKLEAQSLYLAGDNPGARKSLEKALALKPDYSEALELRKRISGTN